jgi:hypothetical protein
MREMLSQQVAQLAEGSNFQSRYREVMLKKILAAAIADAQADMGYIERFDKDSGQMMMDMVQGLDPTFLKEFKALNLLHRLCRPAVTGERSSLDLYIQIARS